jgi:hypothetical protein
MTYAKRKVKYGSFWVVEQNDGKPLACFKSREMARDFIRAVKSGVSPQVAFSQVHND